MCEEVEPWEHEGSIWKTQAAYFSWVRGQIRRSLWSRNPIKNYVKRQAAKEAPANSRAKKVIQCEFCKRWYAQSKIEVDHIIPAGTLKEWSDIGPFMEKMLNPSGGYRLLCKPCHKTHTFAEKNGISFEEATVSKKVIEIMRKKVDEQIDYMKKQKIYNKDDAKNSYKRKIAIHRHLKNNDTTT